MANSVMKDRQGPDWPLGYINVPTPGTPVSIMSLVDSANVNAPETATPGTSGAAEFTERAYEIQFTACKAGATHGLAANTGNVYIVRRGVGGGGGNRDDLGAIVAVLPISPASGNFSSYKLTAAALNRDVFSPYRYFIDADVANEGALVTLSLQ